MLGEICSVIRNYFEIARYDGKFTVTDGVLSPSDFLQEGQYFRIVGSVFNDGVYQNPTAELRDEVFVGEIWSMAPPRDFLQLVDGIKSYAESDAAKPSPFLSESFGGYSYTRGGGDNPDDNSWQKVFANRLNRWRKI